MPVYLLPCALALVMAYFSAVAYRDRRLGVRVSFTEVVEFLLVALALAAGITFIAVLIYQIAEPVARSFAREVTRDYFTLPALLIVAAPIAWTNLRWGYGCAEWACEHSLKKQDAYQRAAAGSLAAGLLISTVFVPRLSKEATLVVAVLFVMLSLAGILWFCRKWKWWDE